MATATEPFTGKFRVNAHRLAIPGQLIPAREGAVVVLSESQASKLGDAVTMVAKDTPVSDLGQKLTLPQSIPERFAAASLAAARA